MCPVCDGEAAFMGFLGMMAWFRCRDCGTEFAVNRHTADEMFSHFGVDIEDGL